MKYFSMFSGIGGFEYGIHRAWGSRPQYRRSTQGLLPRRDLPTVKKPSCVGYSEIDKYAIKVYERRFSEHTNYGDATKINPKELPDFDLLVGGFPCQAFSIAGKRKGFDDTRGTLFFDIARILAEKKPKHLVLENVKGLLSHDKGRTFQTILGVLADLGYRVEWQVLNSKDFGVPQNRERVIIVGHFGKCCGRKVFPITGTNNKDIKQLNQPIHSNDRVYSDNGCSPTLNTMQGGNRQPFIAIDLTRRQPDNYKERKDGRAGTLDANYYKGLANQERPGVKDGAKIRRLTPKECERLQGFPDDWTKYGIGDELISDTQRYKMCGNAVTTNVIQAVMEQLL